MFDRPPEYDPRVDPIVRVEARRLREKLSQYYETDSRGDSMIIELPRGGYVPSIQERDVPALAETPAEVVEMKAALPAPEAPVPETKRARQWVAVTVVAVVAAIAGAATYSWVKGRESLVKSRDSIVLADFTNHTGETVFDLTLRQAMATRLSQSPFLVIVPEERLRETLRVMGRSADDRLSQEVALEVCRRQTVKAMLWGSISRLGRLYVVSVDAFNCQTGEAISRDPMQVETQERVLPAVARMASKMRSALGESLASIQKFDAPSSKPQHLRWRLFAPTHSANGNGPADARSSQSYFFSALLSSIRILLWDISASRTHIATLVRRNAPKSSQNSHLIVGIM